ncbi:putative MACPF domain-containing protein CAD1/NSL1 [Helianthus annuus]|nr:putative MACPF domain-containing protein CAD1/NSL1 [Helianthus annuus]
MALKLPAAEAANVAIQSIGCGYDISLDLRLKYRKGDYCSDDGNNKNQNHRLIEIDEDEGRDIVLPGGLVIPNVSKSIKCDKGERTRFRSDVLSFQQFVCNDAFVVIMVFEFALYDDRLLLELDTFWSFLVWMGHMGGLHIIVLTLLLFNCCACAHMIVFTVCRFLCFFFKLF